MTGGESIRAFVAGATGFTGRALGEQLAAKAGATTVLHVRPDSSRLEHWRRRFEGLGASVDTTAWEPDAMRGMLTTLAPTHVFSVLGTTGKRAATEGLGSAADGYETIDYGLTALLIDAAAACDPAPRFVYLSSVGVREGARGAYMQARARAEAHLRGSGLPFTIVRPSHIVGSRDEPRRGEALRAATVDALVAFGGALGARRVRDRYRSITPDALAAGMIAVALDPALEGAVVHGDDLRSSTA